MQIGLIDVDSHNFPNLALMKISAWHKAQGDAVEWHHGYGEYDKVYMSKVFDDAYSPDAPEPLNAKEIVRGGTGYGLDNTLPHAIEHTYPDYSLYPELTKNTAYGFLTRGCPCACKFCIVSCKEGRASVKVADLSEWWNGQKNIVLLDPNITACPDRLDLLRQLAESKAWVDFTQGVDAKCINAETIAALNKVKIKMIHLRDYLVAADVVVYFLQCVACVCFMCHSPQTFRMTGICACRLPNAVTALSRVAR